MKTYRSAQGKVVDMAALAAKNDKVRAVGNMRVNARGDTIDANGRVIIPVTQKVGETYQKTVGNRTAHAKKPTQKKAPLTKEEVELESELNDDIEVEKIKAKESKK